VDILSNFAQENGIDVKLLKAIIAVEAGGSGFGLDKSLKIRLEAHLLIKDYPNLNRWFALGERKHLDHFYKFPSFSSVWKKLHTGNQWDEYSGLLTAAFQIQYEVFNFISMGSLQIMGFHHKNLGFASALQMYTFMSQSEENDLGVGLRFIAMDSRLIKALQEKDLHTFARIYNGVSGDSVNIYVNRFVDELRKL